eukprot:NODE_1373_length_1195_cov_0.981752.p1 type:complete len:254 gc:universal NODE_1373_length_1195_cov_0.981752:84-845(+)
MFFLSISLAFPQLPTRTMYENPNSLFAEATESLELESLIEIEEPSEVVVLTPIPSPTLQILPSPTLPSLSSTGPKVDPSPQTAQIAASPKPETSTSNGQAACIAALGSNQLPGGLTCHHTYNKDNPLAAGFGGCDLVKTSEGGIRDIELVWAFAKSKGYLVKGGGNCFDVEQYSFNGKSVKLIVMDNGSYHDISIPAYEALTGVKPGPNCEDAVCPIGNFVVTKVGNVKAEFDSFSEEYLKRNYPNSKIELEY